MKSTLLLTTQIGFAVLTLVTYYFFLKELWNGVTRTEWSANRKKNFQRAIIIIPLIFTGFLSLWSLSGRMSDFSKFPFNFIPVLAPPLIFALYLTFSKSFTEVLQHIAIPRLIRLQVFRFFVEVLLWMLFIDGLLPEQMSFEGRNLDILAGITAPIIVWLIHKEKISRTGLIIWNIACLALVTNIVTIAILSTPTPIRMFFEEPANTIVAFFPISFLPGLLVPLAYMLHFFSLRQLLTKPENVMQQAG